MGALGCWNKEHIKVTYRGVDITDDMGLCVCNDCTKAIRKQVDALLKNNEDSQNAKQQPQSKILPCGKKSCRNPHELAYRGCIQCKYVQIYRHGRILYGKFKEV